MKKFSATEAEEFFARLKKLNPEPKTELNYVNPYTLVVAVALSAQATDKGVNKATEALFKKVKTPEAMLALDEAGLIEHIKTVGLYRGKAKNVIAAAKILVDKHGGQVPKDRAALEELPGVGRKTANVVLNVAFGESTMAVDTHIFRIGNRTGIAPGKTTRAVEDGLVKRIPTELLRDSHHWLILHGRYVCKARQPECWRCVASTSWCKFPDKATPPVAKPPKKIVVRPRVVGRAPAD